MAVGYGWNPSSPLGGNPYARRVQGVVSPADWGQQEYDQPAQSPYPSFDQIGASMALPQQQSLFSPMGEMGETGALGDYGAENDPGQQFTLLAVSPGTQGDVPQEQGGQVSMSSIERRQKLAEALMGQKQPVNHPVQALANAVGDIAGAYVQKRADDDLQTLENNRRTVMQTALKNNPGDFNAALEEMMQSGDPDLVDMGLKLKFQAASSGKSRKAPEIVTKYNPDGTAQQLMWDEDEGNFVAFGGAYPRWQSASDESGGDASYDNDGSGNSPQDPSLLDPETITFMAEQYMAGDRSVLTNLGRGKAGVRNVVALRKRIAELAMEKDPETGQPRMPAQKLATAQAELQGFGAFLRTNATQDARIRGAASEARTIMRDVRQLSRELPRSELRAIAKIENEYRAQTNDPRLARLATALNALVNTYSRAISPTGQPTVADKEEARRIIDTSMSQGTLDGVVEIMDREMQAALAAPPEARELRRREYYSQDREHEQKPDPITPWDQRNQGSPASGNKPASAFPRIKDIRAEDRKEGMTVDVGGKPHVFMKDRNGNFRAVPKELYDRYQQRARK